MNDIRCFMLIFFGFGLNSLAQNQSFYTIVDSCEIENECLTRPYFYFYKNNIYAINSLFYNEDSLRKICQFDTKGKLIYSFPTVKNSRPQSLIFDDSLIYGCCVGYDNKFIVHRQTGEMKQEIKLKGARSNHLWGIHTFPQRFDKGYYLTTEYAEYDWAWYKKGKSGRLKKVQKNHKLLALFQLEKDKDGNWKTEQKNIIKKFYTYEPVYFEKDLRIMEYFYVTASDSEMYIHQEASAKISVFNYKGELKRTFGEKGKFIDPNFHLTGINSTIDWYRNRNHFRIINSIYSDIFYDTTSGLLFRSYSSGIEDTVAVENTKTVVTFKNACPSNLAEVLRSKILANKPYYLQVYKRDKLIADFPIGKGFRILGREGEYLWVHSYNQDSGSTDDSGEWKFYKVRFNF